MSSLERIAGWLREVAELEILPRFGALGGDDVHHKVTEGDPEDLVTAADFAAEAWLTARLQDLAPEALVVGEEACARNPALLTALPGAERAFVIDPLDGTKNFARHDPHFGVMVAELRKGEPVASWVHLPLTRELYVAERGAGAWCNDLPMRHPRPGASPLIGSLHVRHLPEALRERVPSWFAALDEHRWSSGCAAREYADIARGAKGFATYYRLAPWDHLPGALLVREAGGVVFHPGSPPEPEPRLGEDCFTVVAASPALAERLREIFSV